MQQFKLRQFAAAALLAQVPRPSDADSVALMDALFGNSPYLTETALQNPEFMTDLGRRGPRPGGCALSAGALGARVEHFATFAGDGA